MAELDKLMANINEKKKKETGVDKPVIYKAGEHPELLDHGVLKSGNLALDVALHGGYRRGSLTIMYGPQGCGKTSLCLESIANLQRQGFICAYIHSEAAFPIEHARRLGVDLSKLIMIQDFSNGEAAFDMMRRLLIDEKYQPRDLVDFLVVDSVGSLMSRAELSKAAEEGLAADTIGAQAKMMTKICKLLWATGAVGKCATVFINQVRDNLSYGGGFDQPGGRALKHTAHVIIRITAPKSEGNIIYENKKQVGHTVVLKVEKNKAGLGGHPGEEAEYVVRYNIGADNVLPLLNASVTQGLVKVPSAGFYQFQLPKEFLARFGMWKLETDKKGNVKVDESAKLRGQDNMVKLIQTTPPLLNVLMAVVKDGADLEEMLAREMATWETEEPQTEIDEQTAKAKELAEEIEDTAEESYQQALSEVEEEA